MTKTAYFGLVAWAAFVSIGAVVWYGSFPLLAVAIIALAFYVPGFLVGRFEERSDKGLNGLTL